MIKKKDLDLLKINMRKILLLSLFVLVACSSIETKSSFSFDKNKWRENSSYRYKIATESTLGKLIKDKDKEEVISLLGEPNQKVYNDFVYCVDVNAPVGSRCPESYIAIHFSEANKVKDITIARAGG
jgi:hypothetical protein